MDYIIKYWKGKETNPIEFINHFRCTTEPIGGGTEHDDDGELVNYDAAIAAISIAEKAIIEKACEWLKRFLDSTVKKPSQVDDCTSDAIDVIEIRRQEIIRKVIYDFMTSMEE